MKNALLLFLTCLHLAAFSQAADEPLSFNAALAKAKQDGKLVFVQLQSPSCRECNAVAEKGLADKELSDQINQTFVVLTVDAHHVNRKQIEAAYNLPGGFGVLFLDAEGTLVHKYGGSSSRPQHYKEQIDLALYRAGESVKVSQFENEYRNGNRTPGLLEQWLLKRRTLNLDNTELLDEYASLLPADSLSSVYTLQFIASMAPVLQSKASKALRQDTALFNRAWYALPANKRSGINAAIIRNSLNKAVREKNESYAYGVATFARSIYPGRSVAGIKSFFLQIMEFYKRTNDTTKFLPVATRYYDLVMRTTNLDSLKRADSALQKRLLQTTKKDTMKTEYGFRVTATAPYSPLAQRFSWELKEGAWSVYKRTADTALLAKATQWIEKAMCAAESPEILDVYARLLYKQRQTEKAVAAEKKAIEGKKKMKFAVGDYEAALRQMQSGRPLVD